MCIFTLIFHLIYILLSSEQDMISLSSPGDRILCPRWSIYDPIKAWQDITSFVSLMQRACIRRRQGNFETIRGRFVLISQRACLSEDRKRHEWCWYLKYQHNVQDKIIPIHWRFGWYNIRKTVMSIMKRAISEREVYVPTDVSSRLDLVLKQFKLDHMRSGRKFTQNSV